MGTHDISLLNITNGEDGSVIEVIKTDGDSHLGGKDVDTEVVTWIVNGIKDECGVDVSGDAMAM